ncbi:Gfo/Idh/MocA family protein [Armatimonas rosea]|uniref:Putative dehydrogenase n=1 Tax=Armatimonas rosea TaxID=685828 RepID=A0A7W9SNB2_ARMRO|nr:Gfo/Idh/MocA family oxidoreductase [Armatimonas rosea]MBB6049777.1 putative dehydrogenase [Armatimonas rosea]
MRFGVALLGLDHWYTAHGVCEIASKSERVALIGVSSPDATHRAWASEKYPEIQVTETAAPLLARDDVHLVAICAPTAAAPELAKQALAAGKHVVAVKPPARTVAELDSVIVAAEVAGKFYGSFEGMQRLTPRVLKLRELLQSGAIGTPLSYHQIGHGGLPSPWPGQPSGAPSWWIDSSQAPTGAWADHAIYAIDLARFVFDGEIVWSAGLIENRVHTTLPLEDYGIALLKLQPRAGGSAVSVMLEDTWAAAPGGGAHRVLFIGTHGQIRPEGNDWIVTANGEETRHTPDPSPFFHLDSLAEALQSNADIPWSAADARANLAACLAVYAGA